MMTADFWRAALERAAKTAAQMAIAAIGTGALGLLDVDWQAVAAGAALGFVLSLLTSLASEPFGSPGTPSLVRRRQPGPESGHGDIPDTLPGE